MAFEIPRPLLPSSAHPGMLFLSACLTWRASWRWFHICGKSSCVVVAAPVGASSLGPGDGSLATQHAGFFAQPPPALSPSLPRRTQVPWVLTLPADCEPGQCLGLSEPLFPHL